MDDPQAESRERFVWPPRRAPGSGVGVTAETSNQIEPTPSVRETGVDPAPVAVVETPAEHAAPVIEAKARRRRIREVLRGLIHDAERTWLDVRCPALPERLAALEWTPDSPDDYCPVCGQSIERSEGSDKDLARRRHICKGTRRPWTRIVRLGPYEPPLTRLVHEIKFTRWRRLGADLGRLLGDALAAAIEQERRVRPDLASRVVVVPAPSTFRRRLVRGIDHARVLADAVAKRVGGRVMGGVLRREHRRSQLAVLPSERVTNMAGAIHPKNKGGIDLGGRLVIVVDDVTTTGATLRGACRAVHEANRRALRAGSEGGQVEVWACVVAVTELGGEG